jgi:hypothetical protein
MGFRVRRHYVPAERTSPDDRTAMRA